MSHHDNCTTLRLVAPSAATCDTLLRLAAYPTATRNSPIRVQFRKWCLSHKFVNTQYYSSIICLVYVIFFCCDLTWFMSLNNRVKIIQTYVMWVIPYNVYHIYPYDIDDPDNMHHTLSRFSSNVYHDLISCHKISSLT